MKKYNIFTQTLLWLMVACVSLTVGCVKDADDSASFGNTATITRDANAQNISYTITANDDWSISSDMLWCDLSVESGYGTETIDIILEPNNTSVDRKATITLVAGGKSSQLIILQSSQLCTLAVTPRVFNAGVAEEKFDIAISSNTMWSATTTTGWINLDGIAMSKAQETLSWVGNGILSISLDENTTSQERTGEITIYTNSASNSETLSETITVTQSANDKPTITISTTALNFLADETSPKSVYCYGTATSLTATTDNTEWCAVLVSGNQIAITPTSNVTNTTPRNTIVTVTAEVNGEMTSEQIVVSQSGNTAPQIFLYNSTYYFSKDGNSSFDIKWLNLTSTAIENVTSTESWVDVTGYTNSSATIEIEANDEVESRTATLRISYKDLKNNTNYQEVTIVQAGQGMPNIYYNDLSLMSDRSSGTLRIIVDNTAAKIGTVATMSDWLTVTGANITSGEIEIGYYADSNQTDASRENVIYIPIKIGETTTQCSVNVTQSGLGAPTISALKEAYVTSEQHVAKEISLWLEGGVNDNVDYSILGCEYQTIGDTGNSGAWISNADITNVGVLTFDIAENKYSDARSAIFTVVAKRGESQTVLDIKVTQGGTATPAIVGLPQEISFDCTAASETFDFELLNGSKAYVVDVFSDYAGMFTSPTESATTEVTSLTIGVSEYNSGVISTFREGIITLKVVNSHNHPLYYDILVRQGEDITPTSVAVDDYKMIYANAGTPDSDTHLIPVTMNGAVKSITAQIHENSSGLLYSVEPALVNNSHISFTATENTSISDREATILLAITDVSDHVTYQTVKVYQPGTTGVDTATTLSVAYYTTSLNIGLQYDTDTYLVTGVENLSSATGYFNVGSYTHTQIPVSFTSQNNVHSCISNNSSSRKYAYYHSYAYARSATIRVFTESKDGRQSYYRDFTVTQGYKEVTVKYSSTNSATTSSRYWYSNSTAESSYSSDGYLYDY